MPNTLRYPFAAVLTAGLVVAPIAAVYADTVTDGSGGVASGNQINVPVDIEADLCGNSLAVLGISEAECAKVSEVLYEASGQAETDGSGGVASGNQINIPLDVALDICGNSAAVGGVSEAECVEVVDKLGEESDSEGSGGEGSEGASSTTDGSGGVAAGNQINIPLDVALDICGNSVAILGASSAECSTVVNVIQDSDDNEGASSTTDGSGGVASGNQVNVPVNAAVDICGNAVSVLGVAEAQCLETISDGEEAPEDDKDEEEVPEDKPEKPEEEPEKPEEDKDKGGDDKDDKGGEPEDGAAEKPAEDGPDTEEAASDLPVTGGALAGLVAAGLAAVGAGGAGLYFARKRKAAVTAEG